MKKKINLGILFGGRSCEHEVSVTSAKSILPAIDGEKYNVHLIGIDKTGHWRLGKNIEMLTENGAVKSIAQSPASTPVSIGLHDAGNLMVQNAAGDETPTSLPVLDVVFPVLHGSFGEDGAIQGALEMAGLPYVGCGVAASALAMDKALAKKIFESAGIPQAPYLITSRSKWQIHPGGILEEVENKLGPTVFAKPANMGSSVGISKSSCRKELIIAINHALEFDNKIVIEQAMENCREIECSVLGNENPDASVPGEIIPGAEFYNYETKYIDDKSDLIIPAPLDEETTRKVRRLSIDAFKAIDGRGLARVDFFVDKDSNNIILNEVNTLPGFTPISMYPRLWAASSIDYPRLIDRLVELAISNHGAKQGLKRAL